MAPKTVKELKSNKKYKQVLNDYFNRVADDYHMLRSFIFKDYLDSNVKYPVNLNRLIANAKTRFDIQNNMSSDLNPLYVIDKIGRLTSMLRVEKGMNGMKLFHILLRAYLSPKMIIKVHRLNQLAFDYLVATIETLFNGSIVQPGEMVGPIAAQSIGEPFYSDDPQHFPFCRCIREIKCYSWCTSSQGIAPYIQEYQDAFIDYRTH